MSEILNKVSESGLITIDPADFFPAGERAAFDIKPLLIEEVLLREKDFREFVKTNDWSVYHNKYVAVFCSADAIIPVWAYMLIAVALEPFARKVVFGSPEVMENVLFRESIKAINPEDFKDAKVVIKGCGDISVPPSAYMEIAALLKPHVKSIMYGEPCSTVPVYKRPVSK